MSTLIHEAGENYLESILMLTKQKGRVRSIDIANHLGVSKPTVSYTMKQFREKELVQVDPEGYITLTPKAMAIAERMLERHNTVARLLMLLGVREATAFEDSCKIEHDISEETFECMKRFYQEYKDK